MGDYSQIRETFRHSPRWKYTIRKVKKPTTIKHVDNNLRASTLNALLLLTTPTSIHANFSIYIHHIHLYTKE